MDALGHRSFEDWLDLRLGLSRTHAGRRLTIAWPMTEADAIRGLEDRSLDVAQLKRLPGAKELPGNRLRLPSPRVVGADDTSIRHRLARPAGHAPALGVRPAA